MDKRWHVIFCDEAINFCPVTDFIKKAKPKHRKKFFHIIEQLETTGPNMPRPYSDILHDGIHELRISLSGNHYRFLYFFCYEKYIVIFQVLVKNTDRVPEKIIESMIEYRKQLLLRITEKELNKNYRNKTSPLSFHSIADESYSNKP